MDAAHFVFFWKPNAPNGQFSQWFASPFEYEGQTYSCAEQAMMVKKAQLFGDSEMERKIKLAKTPTMMKRWGRKVRNFDETHWRAVREKLIFDISVAKFSQNPRLRELLLATKGKVLAVANPRDRIWGIGRKEADPRARDPSKWRGANLLGRALERVRDSLEEEPSPVTTMSAATPTTPYGTVYFNISRTHAFVALEISKALGLDEDAVRELAVLMFAKSYLHGKLTAADSFENYATYRSLFEKIEANRNPRKQTMVTQRGYRHDPTAVTFVDNPNVEATLGGVLRKAAGLVVGGKDCTVWWDTPSVVRITMGASGPNTDIPVRACEGKRDLF